MNEARDKCNTEVTLFLWEKMMVVAKYVFAYRFYMWLELMITPFDNRQAQERPV